MPVLSEIYLAGGCFWGLEKYLSEIRGVVSTDVGYANGQTEQPTYEDVCHNDTGHAETVHVIYDTCQISLPFLLDLYYRVVDPTSINKQGGDVGNQYRTGIYYVHPEDKKIIHASLAELQRNYKQPIVIEVKPLENYTLAERYHQKYLDKNPNGYCHIGPAKFQEARKAIVDPFQYSAPSKEELRKSLSSRQFEVTQQNGTEPPFQNDYWNYDRPGIYVDITTGEPLFLSTDKFDSGCGWPSFTRPIDPHVMSCREDHTHGMNRTEVRSRVGDAHLGHVFPDGPKESGGLRYCINSASLRFVPREKMKEEGYGYLLPYLPPSSNFPQAGGY